MRSRLRALWLCGAFALMALGACPAKAACRLSDAGPDDAPAAPSTLVYTVTGSGRLQFYTAPDFDCPMRGVFVIPRDRLVVYSVTDDGWASVMYLGGVRPTGWVRAERLTAPPS